MFIWFSLHLKLQTVAVLELIILALMLASLFAMVEFSQPKYTYLYHLQIILEYDDLLISWSLHCCNLFYQVEWCRR